ncbi:MAG: DUF547 domain-containing protein [Polyangia bacterium]
MVVLLLVTGSAFADELPACRALYKAVVFDGAVDYEKLAAHPRKAECAKALADARPEEHGAAALAFWVDAYNLLSLLAIADEPERWSVREDGGALFRTRMFSVAGRTLTLDQVEKDQIGRLTHDPRVEFLLSCGSRSCGLLAPDVMAKVTGSPEADPDIQKSLDAGMVDGMRRWFARADNLRVRRDNGTVEVGQLLQLDWHGSDFERAGITLVRLVAEALDQKDPQAAKDLRTGKLRLAIHPYDWRTNRVRRTFILP